MGPSDKTKVSQNVPIRPEHRVNNEIDIVVVQPFGLAQNAFLHKSEAFGDGTAFHIAHGAMKDHAVTILFPEGIVRNPRDCSCYDTLTLVAGIDPVSEFGSPVHPIDVVLADHAGEGASGHNSEGQAVVVACLFQGSSDESGGIVNACAAVEPRKPLFEVCAIAVDQFGEFMRIVLGNLPQFQVVCDAQSQPMHAPSIRT